MAIISYVAIGAGISIVSGAPCMYHNLLFHLICSSTLIKLKKSGILVRKLSARILLWHVKIIFLSLLAMYISFSLWSNSSVFSGAGQSLYGNSFVFRFLINKPCLVTVEQYMFDFIQNIVRNILFYLLNIVDTSG